MTNEHKIAMASLIGQVAGITVGAIIRHAKAVKSQGGSAVVLIRKAVENETRAHNRAAFTSILTKAKLPPLTQVQQIAVMRVVKQKFDAGHGDNVVSADAEIVARTLEGAHAYLGYGVIALDLPENARSAQIYLCEIPAMMDAAYARM